MVTVKMTSFTFYVLVTSPLLVASLAPFHYADNPPAYQDRGSPVRVATISPASSSSTVGNKSTSPANTCFDKPDNYTAIEPGTKCRRYFRCSGGARQSVYLCPGKLVFNGQRCVHPSDFDCTSQSPTTQTVRSSSPSPPVDVKRPEVIGNEAKECDARSDGYYTDRESGCRSYYYCAGGHKATYVCPGKTLFDGTRCVEPDVYQCPSNSSDCQGATNGYHTDVKSACRDYYFCSGDGHKLITLTCAEGRLFDGKKCVDPTQYRCPFKSHNQSTSYPSDTTSSLVARKPATPSTPSYYTVDSRANSQTGQCEKSYGFFAIHGTGCRNYYVCIGGSRTDLQCTGDSLFNGELCVEPDQFICPELQRSDCQGKSDGVYADHSSGCRNYFLCVNQVQTNLSCPSGQLFDGRRCTDGRKVTCNDPVEGRSALAVTPCTGRANGLIPDASVPGCRHYIYCRSGRPYGPVGQCSRSERFSQQQRRCLPKYQVECRMAEDDAENNEDYMMAEASALVTIIGDEELMASTTMAVPTGAI